MADSPIDSVLARLKGVRGAGSGKWKALCPAHDDSTPSLDVTNGRDSRVVMICRAGCDTRAVVAALGMAMTDLFAAPMGSDRPLAIHPRSYVPDRQATAKSLEPAPTPAVDESRTWPVVASYDYVDRDGNRVFQVQRKEPAVQPEGKRRKTFRQRRENGGAWVYNLDGIDVRPMYRLPELLEDLAHSRTILLVEGEKDCDTARTLGFAAAAHACGSKAWRPEYARQLAGATVVILPDNDTPGREWAAQAGAALVEQGASVRMLALPVQAEGADLTDWAAGGGVAQQLDRLISRAPQWAAGDSIPLPSAPPKFKVLSVKDLKALPPLEWLIGESRAGVLPANSMHATFGAPGAGKSFVVTDLACSIASRRDDLVPLWFGNTIRHGPVLYVVAEGGRGFPLRVAAWQSKYGVADEDLELFCIAEPVNLHNAEDISHILRAADLLREPPALVVFDTLARSMVGGDENSAQDVGLVIDRGGRVVRELGSAVHFVHHSKKDSDTERGSTALRGGVDTLCLVREDEESGRVLSCEKQKDADPFDPVTFYLEPVGESCVVSAQAPAGSRALTTNQRAALKTLADLFDRGATATEWLRGSGISDRTFYRVRANLVREGYVSENDRGNSTRYAITASGRWAIGGIT